VATDIWQDRIVFALQKLIQESSAWQCFYLKPHGAECLVFTPAVELQLAKTTGGTVYRYTVTIDVYTASAAGADRADLLQQVANIKRILNDNTHYQTSTTNYYFDGVVDGIEYDWNDDEEWKARITWSGTHEEVT